MSNYLKIVEQIQNHAIHCGRSLEEIKIVVVSKNQPLSSIEEIYKQGCRDFGENRVQEFLQKCPFLKNCHWHFIGTLQKNKINKLLANTSFLSLIHSIDSFELAQAVAKYCRHNQLTVSVLLQVNTSLEISKHGLTGEQWEEKIPELSNLEGINIEGVMTMAPNTTDQKKIRSCFSQLKKWQERWKSFGKKIKGLENCTHLSMGMSNDYLIAIEEGATLLRIGSAIFSS